MGDYSKITLLVDRTLIVDAFLVTVHRHQNNKIARPLRLLLERDLVVIQELDREFSRVYRAAKQEKKVLNYKELRDAFLNAKQSRLGWSTETRNLYGSVLSTIQNWKNAGGRDEKSRSLLATLHPGADLLLQYVTKLQLELPLEK